MKHIKINGVRQDNGSMNYSNLDLSKFVPGSQLYPDYSNDAYVLYDGEPQEGNNVQIITEATYNEHKQRIESTPIPLTPEQEEITQLKQSQVEQDELIMSLLLGGM